MITVITSTLNAELTLPSLIKSLENQTSAEFVWLVIDGKSTDKTLKIISESKLKNISVHSELDNGIYDAINKGVKKCQTDYYVVAGADDFFDFNAIENFNKALKHSPGYEFYAASWRENGSVQHPRSGNKLKHGMRSISSCHSIALLIKKEAHKVTGMYSLKYPICADYHFVKCALDEGGARQKLVNFISGSYATTGASAKNYIDYIFDIYKIKTNYKLDLVQLILLIIRLIRA